LINAFVFICIFFKFLVIKTPYPDPDQREMLDPDQREMLDPDQLEMLDPDQLEMLDPDPDSMDPDPESMNPNPQHCLVSRIECEETDKNSSLE
jgi:hypothetical protein